MNGDLLQSLISSGLKAPDASRVAESLDVAFASPSQVTDAIAEAATADQKQVAAVAAAAALAAVGAASAAEAAAAAAGATASVAASSPASVDLYGRDAFLTGSLRASGVLVSGVASLGGGVVVSQGAQVSGDMQCLGTLTIGGAVNWGGLRQPASVEVLTFATANGGSQVFVRRANVAVLNNYGDAAPGQLSFELQGASLPSCVTSVGSTAVTVVSGVSSSAQTAVVTAISVSQNVVATITTSPKAVVTKVECNTDGTISVTKETVYVVTAVSDASVQAVSQFSGATIYGMGAISGKTIYSIDSISSHTQAVFAPSSSGLKITAS
jgi:hypothetical protein